MAKSGFWRIAPDQLLIHLGLPSEIQPFEPGRLEKLGVGQGLLAGAFSPAMDCGEVSWVGVVDSVSTSDGSARIVWRNADFVLKPTASGRVYWRKYDWFNFSPDVVDRYMLNAIFADIFDDSTWTTTRKRIVLSPREPVHETDVHVMPELGWAIDAAGELVGLPAVRPSSNPTVGYVYLIWSQYGYKIGKAVNVKSRTKLFEVKLPFPIRVEHYARFSDYTRAEKSLHLHFHEKRQEGEWFDLNSDDVNFIKNYGEPQPTENL
jgi:hypothetical protein